MNDRFKFRGVLKLDTQNIVVYSSFLKNYDDELVLSVSEDYFKEQVYKASYKLTKEDWKIVDSYSDQDDYYPWFNFSFERVEQCTGLKDKNGKLIYENDIVYDKFDDCYKLVYWDDEGCWSLKWENICGEPIKDGSDFELYGNIHENADLLE